MGKVKDEKASTDPRRASHEFNDWPFTMMWPEFERLQLLGIDNLHRMRVEELEEDDLLSVRADVPGLDPAKDADAMATYRDGILEVSIPIDQAKASARKIPVERS